MPTSPAPSPAIPATRTPAAYVARIRPFRHRHPALRRLGLDEDHGNALAALRVPITLDGTSPLTPGEQAEVAIQNAAAEILTGRDVCAVLWQHRDAGDLSVMCDGGYVAIANVKVAPARVAERAVA